jgi:hypothetical protein
MKLCFNWKVVAGLAAVGLGIWIVAPDLIGPAISLLLLAACPLSMLLMMRGMSGSQCATVSTSQAARPQVQLTDQEQLIDLKAQLAILQTRQQALARGIAELEAAKTPAVREAEAIASAVDERGPRQL